MSRSREYKAASLERSDVIVQGRFDGETPGEILNKVRDHLVRLIKKGAVNNNEKFKVEVFKKRGELVKGKSRIADAWTIKAKGDKEAARA